MNVCILPITSIKRHVVHALAKKYILVGLCSVYSFFGVYTPTGCGYSFNGLWL